jgi:hypothetical protein
MSRRARQNKTPKSSLDLKPTTINWNASAERAPAFTNTIKRDNRPYTVMQTSAQGTILTSNNITPQFFAKQWNTSDLVQFSSYAAVFDQYKIEKVEFWLTPFGTACAPGYPNNVRIYSVIDYDDSTTPSSVSALQQYENAVTTRCTDGHYVKFRPHIAVAAYGGAFTQFMNKECDWIDVGSTGVQHYGLKVGIDPTAASGSLNLDMITRITVSFRNVF